MSPPPDGSMFWPEPLRFVFNGELSADELRMAEQHAFDGPASWETE